MEELNAAGGILGREVDLFTEDSVGSALAPTKAQKLIERRKVHFLVGEISSGSCGGVMATVNRLKTLYMQTGCNSDALRGEKCNPYTFHVEAGNTMYTKTIGNWQNRAGNVKGKNFYMLTADYAFGHDLARVSTRFLTDKGGTVMANDLIATGTPDYSPYILKIKDAKPDFVYINLAGGDQTTFHHSSRSYHAKKWLSRYTRRLRIPGSEPSRGGVERGRRDLGPGSGLVHRRQCRVCPRADEGPETD